jgi:tetratricopeptide (TPR) repeat protein
MSIAISLAKYDIQGTLKLLIKLIDKLDFSDQSSWTDLDPLGLLTIAKGENEIHLYNEFVREIIRSSHFEMFLFFDLAYFALASDELQEYRIKNLEAVIENSLDGQIQGTSHYNIGNILRSQMGSNAIEHYFKAARLFPDYRNRYYWWREIAGLLFAKKHFQWAEVCYRKSLHLSELVNGEKKYFRLEKVLPKEENLVLALMADCLFLQGKFKEANLHFEKYLLTTKNISQEWILKNMVCLELMNGKLDNIKFNRKKSNQLCEQSLSLTDNNNRIEKLNEAIELYPANGLAWFNLGVALDKELKFEEALFAFLMAGLIQDGDKEAQFNALTISFTQQNLEMMQALLFYITEKYDSSVINDLSDYIMNKNIPLEGKKGLIKAFSEMMEVTKTMHNKG